MGGKRALTVRFSGGEEVRTSCHTNVVPYGLWAAPFYDPARSEAHVRAFVDELLLRRSLDPQLEALWGGHDALAPSEYGIVVVDYSGAAPTLISCNGYSSPGHRHFQWPPPDLTHRVFSELHRAGAVPVVFVGRVPVRPEVAVRLADGDRAVIKGFCVVDYFVRPAFEVLEFSDCEESSRAGAQAAVASRFVLSLEEVAAWDAWVRELEEEG